MRSFRRCSVSWICTCLSEGRCKQGFTSGDTFRRETAFRVSLFTALISGMAVLLTLIGCQAETPPAAGGSESVDAPVEESTKDSTTVIRWNQQDWLADDYSVVRIWDRVVAQDEYQKCTTQSARLMVLFKYLVKAHPYNFEKPIQPVGENRWRLPTSDEDPLSDRYVLTSRAGVLDLVHIASQGAAVASGRQTVKQAVLAQWKAEGGDQFKNDSQHKADGKPFEANPDDLPSNAMGALFGELIRDHETDKEFDLHAAFLDFLRPLHPLPDSVAKLFSHAEIVMGIRKVELTPEDYRKKQKWFTASPFVQNQWIIQQLREKGLTLQKPLPPFSDGDQSLAEAGLEVVEVEGHPIQIRHSRNQQD